MTAGNRPPSRALALAIAISIALHAGVLLNLGSTAQRAANATRPLTARLVPGIPEPAEAPRRATVPPVPLTRSAPKQKAAKAAPPISIPAQINEPDVPADSRIREVIVVSPDIYGLPANFQTANGDLPYSWSSAVDAPPQARIMGPIIYPSGDATRALVVVRALIGTTGLIDEFDVLCGATPFEEPVTSAIKEWSFVPATSRGMPTRTWMLLEFAFLPDNAAEEFDPSQADRALESMRESCRNKLAAVAR
jgi:hypothetical protein